MPPRQPQALPDAVHTPVVNLDLDRRNPRLPERLREAGQRELLEHIASEYGLLRIARSIARNGFFTSEPLIAVRARNRLVVVEGNRRLATMKLLLGPQLVDEMGLDHGAEWRELAASERIPANVPTIIVQSRREVVAVLGYRHIAGIEPWDPWAKARFIAGLVDEDGLSFAEAAEVVGDDESEVRAHYRNQAIVKAAERVNPDAAERVRREFGVFTRSMNSPQLRRHIGAPDNAEVRPGAQAAGRGRREEREELFTWLFGSEDEAALIQESRDLTRLGKVVGSPEGLEALRQGKALEEAEEASGGAKERLLRRLNAALSALQRAAPDAGRYRRNAEVQGLVAEVQAALDALK
jgi:hypothetical protein